MQNIKFKITVFRVIGLCSLTGGYRCSGQDTLLPLHVKTDPERSSKTTITMYQTTLCPNPDGIMNLHHCEHLKSCTKEYEEQVRHGWKCYIGKNELQDVWYAF
jgi:hypothetical protein